MSLALTPGIARARGPVDALMDLTDVLPTLMDAAGLRVPRAPTGGERLNATRDWASSACDAAGVCAREAYDGGAFPGPDVLDGTSLWPLLSAEDVPPHVYDTAAEAATSAAASIFGAKIVRALAPGSDVVGDGASDSYLLEAATALLVTQAGAGSTCFSSSTSLRGPRVGYQPRTARTTSSGRFTWLAPASSPPGLYGHACLEPFSCVRLPRRMQPPR